MLHVDVDGCWQLSGKNVIAKINLENIEIVVGIFVPNCSGTLDRNTSGLATVVLQFRCC
jgi:hypothetical protein